LKTETFSRAGTDTDTDTDAEDADDDAVANETSKLARAPVASINK
jgi:hypothetical protein